VSSITVRGYRGADEAGLLDLWNASLPVDPIDPRTFHRQVLLDPNFHPDWLLVAETADRLVGFCLCLIRRVPFEKTGLQPESGWISAMGVHPDHRRQGAGSALLDAALERFHRADRTEVSIAPYLPNYFVPGVDEGNYADGVAFLTRRGFEVLDRPISMDASIVRLDTCPFLERQGQLREQGIEVGSMQPHEIPALMTFLQEHMPGDWVRHARDILLDISKGIGDFEQFTLAVKDGEVVGYCQFEREHFGPFGVREGMQGRGIGTVLLATCLRTMQRQGLHNAWVLWTGDETADRIYRRFGFKRTRRFAVLRRTL